MAGSSYRQLKRLVKSHPEAAIQTFIWVGYAFFFPGSLGTFWDDKGFYTIFIVCITFPLLFLLNTYWLIPRYLKTKQWFRYFSYALLILIAWFGIATLIFDREGFKPVAIPIGLASAAIFTSFSYRFTRDWLVNIGVIERLKAEKLQMELAFLKSQVDPHFLFNTLNSLYAVALEEKGTRTADGIAQLGTLMRYNLHDSQTEFISLSKEINYIREYIDLQRLRLTEKTNLGIDINCPDDDAAAIQIAPMLLIPFIENAFKYGASPSEATTIAIHIVLEKTDLTMTIKNDVLGNREQVEGQGIGLNNVKSRLNLIYPNEHSLDVRELNNEYMVTLAIGLKI